MKQEQFNDINNTTCIKIKNKDGSRCILLNDNILNYLYKVIEKHILFNVDVSYDFKHKSEAKQLLQDFINKEKLEQYEIEYLEERAGDENFDMFAYSRCLTNIRYPSYLVYENTDFICMFIKSINHMRNKSLNDIQNVASVAYHIMPIYLFKNLSTLIDMGLTKQFIDHELSTTKFNYIKSLNINENTKRKSIINKFRLLRNSLAHGNILHSLYPNVAYHFYDVDEEVNEKVYLGKFEIKDIELLCENIENFILDSYIKKINTIPNFEQNNTSMHKM